MEIYRLIGIIIFTGSFIIFVIMYFKGLKDDDNYRCSLGAFGAAAFGVGLILLLNIKERPNIEYRSSEYRIEYKITTFADQTDTVFVLIPKN